jgi:hypothetical protein
VLPKLTALVCESDMYHYAAVHCHDYVGAAAEVAAQTPENPLAILYSGPISLALGIVVKTTMRCTGLLLDVPGLGSRGFRRTAPYLHLKGDFDTLLSYGPSPHLTIATLVLRLPSLLHHISSAHLQAKNERAFIWHVFIGIFTLLSQWFSKRPASDSAHPLR